MTNFRRINYSNDKQITSIKVDNNLGNEFIWIAFAQNSEGNCIIEKQSAFEPQQSFFSLEREVDAINALDLNTSNIYVAYDDATLFGEVISKNNPLTSTTEIDFPSGITESPIDVQIDSSDVWFLTPGESSGENAKLVKFNTSGTFQETVDLSKSGLIINNARSFTIDSNSDIWIVTYESPVRLVRVFALSGGGYDFVATDIV